MSGNSIAALVLAAFLTLPAASAWAEDTAAAAPPAAPPAAPVASPVTAAPVTAPVTAPAAATVATEPVAMPKPVIRFDSEKADLGTVKAGAAPEHTFTFFNDGNDTLKILSASPS